MKKEDIDRLKEICEKEGFEIIDYSKDYLFRIEKKDPWYGVEFAKYDAESDNCFTYGKIYPISKIDGINIEFKYDDEGDEYGWYTKFFTPSTESEYVDQLKKECFERFGEIKEGDRFERKWKLDPYELEYGVGVIGEFIDNGFDYRKDNDTLMYNGTTIYRQGQWATKLPERVTVEYTDHDYKDGNFYSPFFSFHFYSHNIKDKDREYNKIGYFLAKQLEKYLNHEQ